MFSYTFSFRSLTSAQIAKMELESIGIYAQLERAPKAISKQGCGYILHVRAAEGARTADCLRQRQISYQKVFRTFHNGTVEEASL